VRIPARLTWKDERGTLRFASAVTRDLSSDGVYVECQSAVSIPLYRLVQFQLERDVNQETELPESLRRGRILSAVYRVAPATMNGGLPGFALRLMADPRRQTVSAVAQTRATA
jgi:hypothetical protein